MIALPSPFKPILGLGLSKPWNIGFPGTFRLHPKAEKTVSKWGDRTLWQKIPHFLWYLFHFPVIMKWFYHQNSSHPKSSTNPKPFIEDSRKTSSKFSASHPVDILTSYDFSPVNSFILPCDYSPGNWIRPFQEIWNSRRAHPDSGCSSIPTLPVARHCRDWKFRSQF